MTETAKTYGQALYDLTRDENLSDQVIQELSALSQAFTKEPAFITLIDTPSVAKEERCKILDDSFRGKIQPYLLNFLKILCEKGAMHQLHGCYEQYRILYNEDHGVLDACAVTAIPLSEALQKKLLDKLMQVTGKNVHLTCRVDSSCLGGIRLDIGGERLDGTVRRRLDELAANLKNTVL